jgi:hypothetical protein
MKTQNKSFCCRAHASDLLLRPALLGDPHARRRAVKSVSQDRLGTNVNGMSCCQDRLGTNINGMSCCQDRLGTNINGMSCCQDRLGTNIRETEGGVPTYR